MLVFGHATSSAYGLVIPGLVYLGVGVSPWSVEPDLLRVDEVARRGGGTVEVRRIAEHVQLNTDLLTELKAVGLMPGGTVEVSAMGDRLGTVEVKGAGNAARIHTALAHAVLVSAQ